MQMRTKATLIYVAAIVVPLGVAPLFTVVPASVKGLALIPLLAIAMFFYLLSHLL